MRSNYKKIGGYIREVNNRDSEMNVDLLLGVSIQKKFIPSIANTIGTDMSTYKIIKKNQFAYGPVTSRNGDKISIALLQEYEQAIISQAYRSFEVIETNKLLPEYLMMWFRRPEFDRYARFMSHGSTREVFDWTEMCDTELPVPSLEKQREIVKEYNVIQDRLELNNKLIRKLEETAQAIYKHWFVDFDDILEKEALNEYIEFNPKYSIKKNAIVSYVEMSDVQENSMGIKNVIERGFTSGSKFKNDDTLLARITPCLENGKTAFVNCLEDNEIAFGSTEFITMRAKEGISPYWIYCLARDESFRSHAISSMGGSSGRQRIHSDYLKEFTIPKVDFEIMRKFHRMVHPIFLSVKLKTLETKNLVKTKDLLLSKLATVN